MALRAAVAPVIVPAPLKQTATIIFLHGLGDCGMSWAEILPAMSPPYAKLILPNAPVRPVTLNGGVQMPAWFDLRPFGEKTDEDGIRKAAIDVHELIRTEVKAGTPASRIVLGGFSQGGALALYSGLTGGIQLGGILALSTWLPMAKLIDWTKIQNPPVLYCHGDEDQMISMSSAVKSARQLESALTNFSFKTYPGLDHTINSANEIKDIKQFLEKVLPSEQNSKL